LDNGYHEFHWNGDDDDHHKSGDVYGDDDCDVDIYIMMQCLFVCNEK